MLTAIRNDAAAILGGVMLGLVLAVAGIALALVLNIARAMP